MMTLFSRQPIIAATCLLALFCSGGDFKETKVDHAVLLKQGIYSLENQDSPVSDLPSGEVISLPKGLVDPRLKIFYSTDRMAIVIMCKSSADVQTFDRVIVGQSEFENLPQAPVLKLDANLSADVKLTSQKGEAKDYRVYVVKSPKSDCGWEVALLPVTWTEGTVTLEGKPVRALLRNYPNDKYLMVDLDGNGTFEAKELQEPYPVSTFLSIKECFYKPVASKEDSDFDLVQYQGPFGELSITGGLLPKERPLLLRLAMVNPQSVLHGVPPQGFLLYRTLTNQIVSFKVPAGKYEICHGGLINEKTKNEVIFRVEPADFLPDKPVVLTLDKPKTEVQVSQKGRKLGVQRVLKHASTPKITYSSVAGDSDNQPLTVDVVDAADPQKVLVAKKNMEYG
jgi:hypothetical protein